MVFNINKVHLQRGEVHEVKGLPGDIGEPIWTTDGKSFFLAKDEAMRSPGIKIRLGYKKSETEIIISPYNVEVIE